MRTNTRTTRTPVHTHVHEHTKHIGDATRTFVLLSLRPSLPPSLVTCEFAYNPKPQTLNPKP
jgi:hypothetical protein